MPYEYSDIELDDGEAVIDWLSKQPWSSGAVGMFGISWGGFNAIQLAGRHPPALKAFVAVDATDDLYQDDVHYMDGIMHLDSWEMSQDLDNARPGAPGYVMDEDLFQGALRHATVDADVETRAARRAVLGPRFVARPRAENHRARLSHRRLVRRLSRRDSAHARARRRTGESHDRAVVARLAARALPEARHGVAPRGRALVRSLAEGSRHRHHARAALRRVRARLAPAGTLSRHRPRALALGRRLADRAHRAPAAEPARRSHAGCR